MSGDEDAVLETLQDEITAVLARLLHSRRVLSQEKAEHLDGLGLQIEACAQRIANLPPAARQQMQPLFLALLDEVGQAIKIFRDELEHTRKELTSVHQGRAVGAAYRQIQKF